MLFSSKEGECLIIYYAVPFLQFIIYCAIKILEFMFTINVEVVYSRISPCCFDFVKDCTRCSLYETECRCTQFM